MVCSRVCVVRFADRVGCLKDNVQIAGGPDYCPLSTSLYLRVRCLLVKQQITMVFVSLSRGFHPLTNL